MHGRAGFSEKKIFLPQNWEKGPKMGQKQGFFNLLENLVINFYWIWYIMEIYIICCVPTQNPYLEIFLFLRYGPKCSQPIRLQDFLINHISRINWWNSLIFCLLIQISIIISWSKNVWMGLARNGCSQSGHRTLKVMKWNDFLHGGANTGKQKVISMIFGWAWSKMGVVI